MHAQTFAFLLPSVAMLSAPVQYTGRGNEQTLFQVSDVSSLGSDRLHDHLQTANEMIKKGMQLVSEHCDPPLG